MKYFYGLTWRNFLIALHDVLASVAAVVISFYLRFEETELGERLPLLIAILPYFAILSIIVCYACNLTTTKWRFVSFPDLLNIFRASSILAVSLLVLDYIFLAPNVYGAFFLGKTTIIIYGLLEMFLLSGTRLVYRYFRYSRTLTYTKNAGSVPTLIIGRTADADGLLRGIESGAVKHLKPVGILSPSHSDRGQMIRGLSVIGGLDDLVNVVQDFASRERPIERLVMTPSAFDAALQPEAILMTARRLGLMVSRLPALEEGRNTTPRLAPISIEDLLLRPTATIDYANLESLIRNKAIAVTGGGGSIGSEICDRVIAFGAARLLIVENSEPALYAVTEKLNAIKGGAIVEGRIADIRERERISLLLNEFKPDLVFHAAALKHVPILERDWAEGVKTNIFGTINVADAATAAGAVAMVMISTDKAIEPVSMLGLTKRFAEMYCQMIDLERLVPAAGPASMRLISVRFGNVLGSNGSVVPKFKAQIESGGPVTITDPEMVRFFMTIREACDLVISAAAHALTSKASDVSVYVLNMGQPVKIVDLAERMIKLSGLEPGRDIDIAFTGMRPGERLHEILFAEGEPTRDIGVSGVMAAVPIEPNPETMKQWIGALRAAVSAEDRVAIRSLLKQAVPEFKSTEH